MKTKFAMLVIVCLTLIGGGMLITKNSTAPREIDLAPQSLMPADKIEVVNFYGTQRCAACLTLGRLTKQTIDQKFSQEVKSGKIEFIEINGQLPQNHDTVVKYQARGSSLYFNVIRDQKDEISEDVTVWRLIGNETQFTSYVENKLNNLLGK